MIIFSEKTQYDNLIKNGFKKYVNVTDLSILGRAWAGQGFTKDEIRQKMIDFSIKFCPSFNAAKYEGKLIQAIENSFKKDGGIKQNEIIFYKEEIDDILNLKDKNLQKVLFIMMCLAKKDRHNYIYLNAEGIYKLSEIYKLAKVSATKIEQEESLYYLKESKSIFCNIKPFLKYDLLFIKENGTEILRFLPNENMISEFIKVSGISVSKGVKFKNAY